MCVCVCVCVCVYVCLRACIVLRIVFKDNIFRFINNLLLLSLLLINQSFD